MYASYHQTGTQSFPMPSPARHNPYPEHPPPHPPQCAQSFPPSHARSDAFHKVQMASPRPEGTGRPVYRALPAEHYAQRQAMSAQPRQSEWHVPAGITSPSLNSNDHQSLSSTYGERAPKDFAKPLTCFYWAHKGYCNKTDDECLYAHRMTGVVAEPPQRVAGGRKLTSSIPARLYMCSLYKQLQLLGKMPSKLSQPHVHSSVSSNNRKSLRSSCKTISMTLTVRFGL